MYFLYTATILVLSVALFMIFQDKGKSEHFYQKNRKVCPITQAINHTNLSVYVINLDRNKERLDNFIEQYIQSDLKEIQFNRMRAIDGKALRMEDYVSPTALKEILDAETNGYRTKHYQLSRGGVGCYLSHQGVYKKIAEQDTPYALIFEDDVDIDPQLLAKSNVAMKLVPDDWDIVLLSCFCIKCDRYDVYSQVERFYLLHAYMIRKEAAAKMFKLLEEKPVEQQIDWEISSMITRHKFKVYCLRDSMARQKGFTTNIQTPLKIVPGINPYTTL